VFERAAGRGPRYRAAMSDSMRRKIPNLLTVARVILAGCFFAIVAIALWPDRSSGYVLETRQVWGNVAVVVFAVAAITDFVDGLLARRWGVVSVFGRVMDPFGDKLLVIGAFIFLASPAFLRVDPQYDGVYLFLPYDESGRIQMTTGVRPWMVAIILARELLVTSIRGVFEGLGIDFSAGSSGKWKMVLQSITAPFALFVAVNPFALESALWIGVRDILVWSTILVTVWSAWPYLVRARLVLGGDDAGASSESNQSESRPDSDPADKEADS
jgi:CDP-diacylglycerol---glycerol-3-phosphate 3-phosphatidyltransferase